MPHTNLMLELQVTKEYLGQRTSFVYLGPLFEEALRDDTWAKGAGLDGGAGDRRLALRRAA